MFSYQFQGKHIIRGFHFDTKVLPSFFPEGPYLAEIVFSDFRNGTFTDYLRFDTILNL